MRRNVLVTGATGYVGGRLVPSLIDADANVTVLVRNRAKLDNVDWAAHVTVIEGDADVAADVAAAMDGQHTAVYLLHSIGTGHGFDEREAAMAATFAEQAAAAGVRQIVYLGGIANDERLSDHLASRARVGQQLRGGGTPVLELRAGIVLGSGSASFEMLRYLTEHLPAMITPKWARNRTQPIAARDVVFYLTQACLLDEPVDATVDIVGPDTLTYIDMMHRFARIAGLRPRVIVPVPLLTPRLSSLWVGLVTPVPSQLARPLIDSLTSEVVADARRDVTKVLSQPPGGLTGFDDAVAHALLVVGYGQTPTRWSDAGGTVNGHHATLTAADPKWAGGTEQRDERTRLVAADAATVWQVIERIGGDTGWYGFDWAWHARGFADRLVGGVGLRRGRRDPQHLRTGDSVDFWRVETIDAPRRLLLRAEMRVPGLARLEFTVDPIDDQTTRVTQRALWRPRGLGGRAYWLALEPVHRMLFPRMLDTIAVTAQAAAGSRSDPD